MESQRTVVGDVTRIVNVPIGRIWAVTSTFGPEAYYFPGVLKASLKGYGIGSIRHLTFADFEVEEILEKVDEATHTTQYRILDGHTLPYTDPVGVVSLEELGPQKTKIHWTSSVATVVQSELEGVLKYVDAAYNGAIDGILKVAA
jgi:hypothetical protein